MIGLCLLSLVLCTGAASAQDAAGQNQVLDAMRQRDEIGESDQGRIARWIEDRVAEFTDAAAITKRFKAQYEHPSNSPQFTVQFVTQTANVAASQFAKADLQPAVAYALARVLVDMDSRDTYTGLIAGLKSTNPATRYLCVRGLGAQRTAISSDKAKLDATVQALRNAGLVETSPAVLGRIYEALVYSAHVAEVFDAYLSLFDKRLELRRRARVIEDGAETYALEFFRTTGILASLGPERRAQLAGKLAVFLRIDAERYNTPGLTFDEIDKIERLLDGMEAILSDPQMVGSGKGGEIRKAMSASAHANRRAVLEEAYRWVGHPDDKTPGALNEAPWSVPIGAP